MAGPSPTERFTGRAEAYAAGRPGYPDAAVTWVVEGLPLQAVAVDVGAGTGAFTAKLLERGLDVIALEPNEAMRAAADDALGDHVGLDVRAGSGEATGLGDRSVDLVTCAQTFHWLDPARFAAECRRILRAADGRVAVLWNHRRATGSTFAEAYEAFARAQGSDDYRAVADRWEDRHALRTMFGDPLPERRVFPHAQRLDLDGLRARAASSSYLPAPGSRAWAGTEDALRALFHFHAEDGVVTFDYDCVVYAGPPAR